MTVAVSHSIRNNSESVLAEWFEKLTGKNANVDNRSAFSLVLLLSEEGDLPEDAIQSAAEAAFIDVVEQRGAESVFALQSERITVVRAGEEMLQIVQGSASYFPDCEAFAKTLTDSRVRAAVLNHKAWLSIDYLSGRRKSSRNRVAIYRQLALLAAELSGITTLAIYFVDENVTQPYDAKLRLRLEYFDTLDDLLNYNQKALH